MPTVLFTTPARVELLRAIDWYNAQQPNLGHSFAREVERAVERMANAPLRFPIIQQDVRRVGLRRFPYGLFFQTHPGVIQVIACFHTSRAPDNWQQRL